MRGWREVFVVLCDEMCCVSRVGWAGLVVPLLPQLGWSATRPQHQPSTLNGSMAEFRPRLGLPAHARLSGACAGLLGPAARPGRLCGEAADVMAKPLIFRRSRGF